MDIVRPQLAMSKRKVLIDFPGLIARDHQMANILDDFAGDDPGCWPAVATLARRIGVTRRTVQMSLARLIAAGAVEAVPTSDNPTGRILMLRWARGGAQSFARGANVPPPVPADLPPCPAPTVAPDTKKNSETKRNVVDDRPIRTALDAIGPETDIRRLAYRIAHRLRDGHSAGYYMARLREAAHDVEAKARLIAAYAAAERAETSGTSSTPGKLFVHAWKVWEPPLRPSEINPPTFYTPAPRPEVIEPPGAAMGALLDSLPPNSPLRIRLERRAMGG